MSENSGFKTGNNCKKKKGASEEAPRCVYCHFLLFSFVLLNDVLCNVLHELISVVSMSVELDGL